MLRSRLLIAIAAAVTAAALLFAPGAMAGKKAKYDVTVTRDKAGIPHIDAGDFKSLGYGQGYSYAQDVRQPPKCAESSRGRLFRRPSGR